MIHSPSHNLLYIIGRPLTAYEDPKQLINIMFTLRKRLSRILHRWGWRGGKTEPLGGSNDHQSQIGWWRPQKKRNWDCYNSTICRWPWLTLTLTKHRLRHSWRFEEDGDDGRVRTKVQPSPTDLRRSWTCPTLETGTCHSCPTTITWPTVWLHANFPTSLWILFRCNFFFCSGLWFVMKEWIIQFPAHFKACIWSRGFAVWLQSALWAVILSACS